MLFSSVIEEADDFAIKFFSPVRLCREKDSIAKFRFTANSLYEFKWHETQNDETDLYHPGYWIS
ncbi:MAG: hypothetical protein K8S27_09695, partial [Candidatus Omnitrophica bacterium]|nr:hypothetical protein [Candidatus Omnitrophota bacterium]